MAHMTLTDGKIKEFSRCTTYDGITSMKVDVNGITEEVEIDPELGPRLVKVDGSAGGPHDVNRLPIATPAPVIGMDGSGHVGLKKPWKMYTSTEMKVCIMQAARINRARKARFENALQGP
mmetsp:Transcript_85435/g.178489  ORF Transcript_85435/g.178489 Transcript_85435/m.178489 type:complete len:120 (-) Transcript_85435:277-636(-)